jgi:putative intracellular protease/amidase
MVKQVSGVATDSTAAETNRETGSLTVSRTGSTAAALVVNYTVAGTATNGTDYTQLAGSVLVSPGQSSATIVVQPVDDTVIDANETVAITLGSNPSYTVGSSGSATITIADNDVPVAAPLPVLLVIANNDFYYQEYADPRTQFEAAGISVVVGAGRRELSTAHANSGQGSGNGQVMPDIALADANAANYSAIVFVGGWGATQYQYAFTGTYNNVAYNGTTAIRARVNELINDFVTQEKIVAGVCHGVSVLAWARVNGQSLLQGRTVTTAHFNSPTNNIPEANMYRWHSEANGATVFTGGALGNTATRADDVVVDGRIITGENYDSARQFGISIAERIPGSLTNTLGRISGIAVDPSAAETNRETGSFTVSRTGSTAAALVVNFTVAGTATNTTDYTRLTGSLLISPGHSTDTIYVQPVDDNVVDANETVVISIASSSAYTNGDLLTATIIIGDNDIL